MSAYLGQCTIDNAFQMSLHVFPNKCLTTKCDKRTPLMNIINKVGRSSELRTTLSLISASLVRKPVGICGLGVRQAVVGAS